MALEVTPDGYVVDTAPPEVPEVWKTRLDELLQGLPGAGLLSVSMKNAALVQSQIPDAHSVWPGQDGYHATYDIYWAAINLVGFLQAQPVVRQSSSEGTSIAVDAPNWGSLLGYYRSMSVISQANSGPILTAIPIPGGPHVYRTDMRGRSNGYDDVDTDLG